MGILTIPSPFLRRQEFNALASPHPSFPRRRESSKNIGFSHEGDDVPPFHADAKILDSRLRGNDGVSTVFVISSSARPVTGRRLRPLQGILGGKGFLQRAMTLGCPVGAATCRPLGNMATLSRPFGAPSPTSGRGDVYALSVGQNDSPRPLAGEGMGERATCTPRFSLDSLSFSRKQEFNAFASPHPSFPRRRTAVRDNFHENNLG